MAAPARPDLDTGALLRLAAVFDSEHPTHRTLLNLARVAQARNTASALLDLDLLHKKINRGPHPEATTAIAARPLAELTRTQLEAARAGRLSHPPPSH